MILDGKSGNPVDRIITVKGPPGDKGDQGDQGDVGPQGDQGFPFAGLTPALDGTAVQGMVQSDDGPVVVGSPVPVSIAWNSTVTHGVDASVARPPVSVAVIWIGSVQPTNAIDGDIWLDTSGTAPVITTAVLNSLNKDAVMSQQLVASGTTPLIWSLDSGSLPDGLLLSTDGDLYGSPTTPGSYSFTVKAVNPFGDDTQAYTGTVGSAVAPTITTTSLTTVTQGVSFSQTLGASGSSPFTWSVESGSLPDGLSLDTSTGVLSGTASTVGSYSFTVRVTNGVGYDDQAFTGSVVGTAPTITTTSLAALYRAFSTSQTLAVSGSAPITFAVQSGSLPAGLSLDTSTGVIDGTPSATGSYSFTIRATNSYGHADQAFSGSVLESTPVIVETSLSTMQVSSAFSQTLTLSTGGPTITWSVQSGTLPDGLSLDTSTGAITGAPTTSGSYSFTIRADNGSEHDDQAFTGSVNPLSVLFDTTVSKNSATSPSTMTGAAAMGAGGLLFVGSVTNSNTATIAATYDGVALTQVGSTITSGAYAGMYYTHLAVFKLDSAPGGSKSIVTSCSGAVTGLYTTFVSYAQAATIGSLQSIGTGASLSLAQTATSASGHKVAQCFFVPLGTAITGYNKTLRGQPEPRFIVGDADGAATVAFSATATTSSGSAYHAVAVDMSPT